VEAHRKSVCDLSVAVEGPAFKLGRNNMTHRQNRLKKGRLVPAVMIGSSGETLELKRSKRQLSKFREVSFESGQDALNHQGKEGSVVPPKKFHKVSGLRFCRKTQRGEFLGPPESNSTETGAREKENRL